MSTAVQDFFNLSIDRFIHLYYYNHSCGTRRAIDLSYRGLLQQIFLRFLETLFLYTIQPCILYSSSMTDVNNVSFLILQRQRRSHCGAITLTIFHSSRLLHVRICEKKGVPHTLPQFNSTRERRIRHL